ncbi:hypothetical protein DPMN_009457 [Dreissena polymorpha]|uniref:Uncharacterized protein n=1 Tax=Dreissena polymorpha TaxID=45954 RepID=A0A9D4S053_DREPO|nr:hypothetical protein DPMN_009457 [Dreissena polymorpha]
MWTDGQRTKTNPKTSPEQSAIFQLVQEINKTKGKNVTSIMFDHKVSLYIFHDDWAKNVTSRVFTCFHYIHIEKNAIFKLDRDFIGTNLLTKFHEDRTINVASRVFKNKCGRTDKDQSQKRTVLSNQTDRRTDRQTDGQKTATSPWQPFLIKIHENLAKNVTSRVLTCFHYIHIEKNAPPTGDHVFSPIWTIFKLVRVFNKTNFLTNFHDDWANIVTSRVFTRKTAPPTGGHVFQRTGTTFELNQHII